MPRTKLKKGDTVVVNSGPEKGKEGKIIAVFGETGRVIVEGVKRITKHTKMNQNARGSRSGGIVTQEAAIHISNVQLIDPKSKKPTRVGIRTETVDRDGKSKTVRVRVAKRSGEDI